MTKSRIKKSRKRAMLRGVIAVGRLTSEGGKVRPWTVDNVARISEMAEAYVGQGGEE